MKIAIVGAGFTGLAVAWHLAQLPNSDITLFDRLEIGGGTSGMAAGLLHPFAGPYAKKNWRGDEGLAAALPLLDVASKALGKPVYLHSGLLRVALNPTAEKDYRLAAEKNPDVEWLENCQSKLPDVSSKPGIFIHHAYKVFGDLYLQGLWQACEAKGVRFIQKFAEPALLLGDFDCVIAATGGETPFLNALKGQLLQVSWPSHLKPLPFPISSQYYIAMDRDQKSCFIGGTYEHSFSDATPDWDRACAELWPKALELYPPLAAGKILTVKAGLRSTTPNHRPFLKEVTPNLFILAGMGSKGLLYSALYAGELALSVAERF